MTREKAEEYAKTMTYEDALHNLLRARAIPYRKATFIKVSELINALSQEPKTDKPKANKLCEMCGYRKGDWCIRPKDYICKALSQEPTEDKCWYCKHTYEPTMKQFAYYDEVFKEQQPCDDTVSIQKDVLKCRVGKLVVYNVEWLKKHWQMEMDIVCGVKPCDDVVSRGELLKAIDTWDKFGVDDTNSLFRLDNLSLPHYVPYIHYDDVIKCIKGLPSVTQSGKWIDGVHAVGYREGYKDAQKQKSGKWIDREVYDADRWKCSECGRTEQWKENYCPNCGAKMVEPQESEDKE